MLKCEFYCTSDEVEEYKDAILLKIPFSGINPHEFDETIQDMTDQIESMNESVEGVECKYDLNKCYSSYIDYFISTVFKSKSKYVKPAGVKHYSSDITKDKLYISIAKEDINKIFRKNTKNYQKALYNKFGRYNALPGIKTKSELLDLSSDFFIQWYEQKGYNKLEPTWYNIPRKAKLI